MAIDYTVLFDRIGKGIYLLDVVNEFFGSTVVGIGALATDLPTELEDFVEKYDGATPRMRGAIGDSNAKLNESVNSATGIPSWVAQSLANTIVVTMDEFSPLPGLTIEVALTALIKNMVLDTKTVNANAAGGSATPGAGNLGNGAVLVSMKDGAGKSLEYVYAETLAVTFSSATSATVTGPAKASYLSPSWPRGSAANKTISPVTAAATGLVVNGDFELFAVANTPDSWTLAVGAAGTAFFSEASIVYGGSKALKITSNGVLLYEINQNLAVGSLKSKTPYAINFFAKMGSAPSTGVLTIDLYDGTAVINDEAGVANSFTVDLTTLGTTYVQKGGAFRLPEPMPAIVNLRVRVSTAIENTKILYIDHMAMAEMTQLYTGGPFVAMFTGTVAWNKDDVFSIAITNDYGGKLQTEFWRMFDMPAKGMVLPSNAAGAENILDTVIS